MFLRNKNKIYVITAIIICVGILFIWFLRAQAPASNSPTAQNSENFKTVRIGTATIRAELATTKAEQVQGLSGRTSLPENTGMLFVFDRPSYWSIWMKDMNFPIDVLWITDDFKVSDIVENMLPTSYPKTYMPHVPVRYVLEVPIWTVKTYGIAVGQAVVFK
jgi:uncharacterized membrane protein (UPF0127 family)